MADTEVKLFGKWSYDDVSSPDISLTDHMAVKQKTAQVYLPHTAGRWYDSTRPP